MHQCDLASLEVQYRLWAVKRCEKRLFCVGYLQTSSIDFVVCEPLRPNPRHWQKQNANRSNTFHKTSNYDRKLCNLRKTQNTVIFTQKKNDKTLFMAKVFLFLFFGIK